MRLAILCDNGEVVAEYTETQVREELGKLLKKYTFEESWDFLCTRLYNELRRK